MLHLPPPFHAVPLSFEPLSVDRSMLVELVDGLWADDHTVVVANDMVELAVHGTQLVELDVRPGAPPEYPESLLYGFATRVLFIHSGVFCLHASLLRFDNGSDGTDGGITVAVAGASGAGKSTTVSYTAQRHGARVLVDDVLPITVADGVATAYPYPRPVHLLPDSAERVGLARRPGDEPDEVFAKLVVDLAESSEPVTIDHLVMLELASPDAVDALVVRELRGAERLRRVVRCSNSTGLSSFGARSESYLQWATALASSMPMTELVRRPGDDTLDAVADHIAELSRTRPGLGVQRAEST